MDKVIVIDMGAASISDVAVELNPTHRSSCYSGYADTGLTSEGLPLIIRRFKVWPSVIDFSEVKNVFHNHGVRLGCSNSSDLTRGENKSGCWKSQYYGRT